MTISNIKLRTHAPELIFWMLPAYLIAVQIGFMLGGIGLWAGVALNLLTIIALDSLSEDIHEILDRPNAPLANAALYVTAPIVISLSVSLAYFLSPVGWAGLEQMMASSFGYDPAAARNSTTTLDLIGGCLSLGTVYAAVGGTVGHELVHRVNSQFDRFLGGLLLAFSFDPTFPVEHVYGHHRTVATFADPTFGVRGVGFWSHVPKAISGSIVDAFQIEAVRLSKRGLPAWSLRNRALFWPLVTVAIAVIFASLAGWRGLLGCLLAGVLARLIIENINYVAHYGVVRIPERPVCSRHSWNCYRRLSSGFMFNLARHSSHHVEGSRKFWRLETNEAWPIVPYPIGVMVIIALFPPLWHRVMEPKLLKWDNEMASDEERELLAQKGLLLGGER